MSTQQIINIADTIQLSNVKGIIKSDSIKITAPSAMNGVGSMPIELPKESVLKIDTTINKIKFKDTSEIVISIIDTSKINKSIITTSSPMIIIAI